MKQQVLTKQITIRFDGEIQTFQIKLPEYTVSVIGIETGFRMVDSPDPAPVPGYDFRTMMFFNRNTVTGELKLQSCETANIFYSSYLKTENNAGFGDFSRHSDSRPLEYLHQLNREEIPVCVKGKSTVIRGFYKDRLGESLNRKFNYVVSVHLWIETQASDKEDTP